jgi:hypothetical protein
METFYFLFKPNPNNWGFFYEMGYTSGFIIVFFSSLVISCIFYLGLGRYSGIYAKVGKWFISLLISILIVFILTLVILSSQYFPDVQSIGDIPFDIWIFSILNGTIYTVFWYLIDSIILNNFSLHSRYIPFNLFKT